MRTRNLRRGIEERRSDGRAEARSPPARVALRSSFASGRRRATSTRAAPRSRQRGERSRRRSIAHSRNSNEPRDSHHEIHERESQEKTEVARRSRPRSIGDSISSTDVLIGADAPYDPEMATEHAYAVLDRINALRADRSLPRALRITGVDDVRLILEAHAEGRITFAKARHRILEWLANTTHRRTWSWVGVYVPDAPLPVLDEMVGSGRNEFVVELVYVRPTTAALGHYLLCIAWFD